jgi:hypothetical protein
MNNAHDAHKMSFISKISGATKEECIQQIKMHLLCSQEEWQHVLSMKLSIAMMCV